MRRYVNESAAKKINVQQKQKHHGDHGDHEDGDKSEHFLIFSCTF